MWEPRHLSTLQAYKASYKDSFTFSVTRTYKFTYNQIGYSFLDLVVQWIWLVRGWLGTEPWFKAWVREWRYCGQINLTWTLAKKRSKQSFGCRTSERCAKENSENHVQAVKVRWRIYLVLFSNIRIYVLAHHIKYKGKDKYLRSKSAAEWEAFLFRRSAVIIEVPLFLHENTGTIPQIMTLPFFLQKPF
jgi:hypothetical protein